jgi:hypothetical protein
MVVWLGISLEYLNTRRSGYALNGQNFGAFKRHYLIKQIMAKILKKLADGKKPRAASCSGNDQKVAKLSQLCREGTCWKVSSGSLKNERF